MNTETRAAIASRIDHTIKYGDADGCVMRVIQVLGRGNLPRSAREMSFAAQDYVAETKKSERTGHGVIERMLTAPRRPEWPA